MALKRGVYAQHIKPSGTELIGEVCFPFFIKGMEKLSCKLTFSLKHPRL